MFRKRKRTSVSSVAERFRIYRKPTHSNSACERLPSPAYTYHTIGENKYLRGFKFLANVKEPTSTASSAPLFELRWPPSRKNGKNHFDAVAFKCRSDISSVPRGVSRSAGQRWRAKRGCLRFSLPLNPTNLSLSLSLSLSKLNSTESLVAVHRRRERANFVSSVSRN